jgi:hypothetical protein
MFKKRFGGNAFFYFVKSVTEALGSFRGTMTIIVIVAAVLTAAYAAAVVIFYYDLTKSLGREAMLFPRDPGAYGRKV